MLSRSVVFNSLQPHRLQPPRLLCPGGFSKQNYWSGLPSPPSLPSEPAGNVQYWALNDQRAASLLSPHFVIPLCLCPSFPLSRAFFLPTPISQLKTPESLSKPAKPPSFPLQSIYPVVQSTRLLKPQTYQSCLALCLPSSPAWSGRHLVPSWRPPRSAGPGSHPP